MSATRALQRVVVRMLYDPPFVDRIYEDAACATHGVELTPAMHEWLVAPDRRAYKVDPLRRSRSLTSLIEEFAVSVASLARGQGEPHHFFDSYFSSPVFHQDVQRGVSLAQSFGDWLLAHDAPSGVVTLERTMASARRDRESGVIVPEGTMRLAAGVRVVELPGGTIDFFAAALALLRSDARGLHEGALSPARDFPEPAISMELEGVLVDDHDGDLRLESMSIELAGVLGLAASPLRFADFVRAAAAFDATPEDCAAICESFAGDGLLVGFNAS